MKHADPQHWFRWKPFDPTAGEVIRTPPSTGKGYWVGAPGVMFDETDGVFYLTYRVRRPRGVHPDRGAEVHLAASRDGIRFDDIWVGTKDQLGTTSIERCGIRRLPDAWALYVSYVDPADGRWRIDMCEAASPSEFQLSEAKPILTAAQIGAEGVKDPFLFRAAGENFMVVSFASADAPASSPSRNSQAEGPSREQLHGTHDAYNTGLIRSRTGLASSSDGREWRWEGPILEPSEQGWDRYCARIGTLLRQDGMWIALYDGSADVSENYEERVGLAWGADLRSLRRATPSAPLMKPPHGDFALRYFDALDFPDATFFYYEMALPDGSHDLRVIRRTA